MEKQLIRWPEDKTEPPTPGQPSVEVIYNGKHYYMHFDEWLEAKKYFEGNQKPINHGEKH